MLLWMEFQPFILAKKDLRGAKNAVAPSTPRKKESPPPFFPTNQKIFPNIPLLGPKTHFLVRLL